MSCTLGFGELNIPSSRAFWDDCEDDELTIEPAKKLLLDYDDHNQTPLVSDVFLIVEGFKVAEFANKTLLKNTRPICKIPSQRSSLNINENDKLLLAIIEDDLENSGEITELLIPYARLAKKLITLTLRPKVDYKSEEINKYTNEIAIIRGINSQLNKILELEAPNFIAGVTAGLASWRENEKLPISSYVVYTDKLPLDAIAAQPVIKLLKNLGVSCSVNYTPTIRADSYLYL